MTSFLEEESDSLGGASSSFFSWIGKRTRLLNSKVLNYGIVDERAGVFIALLPVSPDGFSGGPTQTSSG